MNPDVVPDFVIKLGGSLLTLPDLAVRMRRLLDQLQTRRVVIVTGGGTAADVVREWEQRFQLGDQTAHQLAIDSLSLTARLVQNLLPESRLLMSLTEAETLFTQNCPAIADPGPLLKELESECSEQLPCGWHVTTDSIAAWLTRRWLEIAGHSRKRAVTPHRPVLVLLKSVDCPQSGPQRACDVVDEWFPEIARHLPRVLWCNLRSSPVRICEWSENDEQSLHEQSPA